MKRETTLTIRDLKRLENDAHKLNALVGLRQETSKDFFNKIHEAIKIIEDRSLL